MLEKCYIEVTNIYNTCFMGNDKVCLTTFIYGDAYQAYIPFLVYSCHKSYPEYDIVLFVYGALTAETRHSLDYLSVPNYIIIENAFADCPQMSSLKAKSLRWVLWDDSFADYDYLYTVDIDMVYQRENIPLHEQHKIHMHTTGLCFDNMRRQSERHPFQLISLLRRIKYAGFKRIFKFLLGERVTNRASGLHFVRVKDYYAAMTETVRREYTNAIYRGSWLKDVMTPNNEALLYYILQDLGLKPEKMAIQSNSYKSIDYENPERVEFRPHHGIHLGIFRSDIPFERRPSEAAILKTKAYQYYFRLFHETMYNDEVFRHLLTGAPENIKASFERMFRYAYNEE